MSAPITEGEQCRLLAMQDCCVVRARRGLDKDLQQPIGKWPEFLIRQVPCATCHRMPKAKTRQLPSLVGQRNPICRLDGAEKYRLMTKQRDLLEKLWALSRVGGLLVGIREVQNFVALQSQCAAQRASQCSEV